MDNWRMNTHKILELRSRIANDEQELERLKAELQRAEDGVRQNTQVPGSKGQQTLARQPWLLEADEYKRYGRQMILPEISLQGQLHLKNASVLLVGLGGLGCPAAAYLAGAGIGTLGLMDGDNVELSNLHRQILHATHRVGMPKVESAKASLETYVTYATHLTPAAAPELFASYDVILDCTDQPASRYLISDAAVLAGKPVVSGAALRTDGVLNVLNAPRPTTADPAARGPCYRCIYPVPPPPETVTPCAEGGVLGPVVGTMGVLMALEAIKLIVSGAHRPTAPPDAPVSAAPGESQKHSMLLFSAMAEPQFRIARLRGKRADCVACSSSATISAESLASGSLNYAHFCGVAAMSRVRDEHRISARQLFESISSIGAESERVLPNETKTRKDGESRTLVLDVRPRAQFMICNLSNSINVPITELSAATEIKEIKELEHMASRQDGQSDMEIIAICRQGNDSQEAVQKLQALLPGSKTMFKDVIGGFEAWREQVDKTWPDY